MKKKFDVAIMNFATTKNVGGLLQNWALQRILRSLKKTSITIKLFRNKILLENFDHSFAGRFTNDYVMCSDPFLRNSMINANVLSDCFIFGSDCIWNNWWGDTERAYLYLGSFCNCKTKLIAYAPSFGNRDLSCTENEKLVIKYWLSRFDNISVREKSGVNILKNDLGIEGTQVLDPTLLLDANDYKKLIRYSKNTKKDHIFVYSIGVKEDDFAFSYLMERIKSENVYSLSQEELDEKNISVEDWLSLIKNAKLLVTNSYHALCLAIKFNVPFYLFSPYGLDSSRFESLLEMLNLEDRLIATNNDFQNITNLFKPIDWIKVNLILEKEKEQSIEWLKNALDTPKDLSKRDPEKDAMIIYMNNFLNLLNNTKMSNNVVFDVLNYNKIVSKYNFYKLIKFFVVGKTKEEYIQKEKKLYEKISYIKTLKRSWRENV